MMPQVIFGSGKLRELEAILVQENAKRILLVTGKHSYQACGAEAAIRPMLAHLDVAHFSDFAQNPQFEDICRGVGLAKAFAPDLIVAVGGGSVLDMAKLQGIFAANSADVAASIRGDISLQPSRIPMVAIPTTAGTGSEATHFAVAYIGHSKYSVAHASMLPRFAVVDPDLTRHLPPRLTAVTGLDALCQAIESYWAVNATDESRAYAEEAITLLMTWLERAVNHPGSESRGAVSYAAYLAGKAINISKTTAPHAISYSLTSFFGVSHGHAVALTLGKCFLVNAGAAPEQICHPWGERFQSSMMPRLYALLGETSAEGCEARWQALLAAIGLESRLADVGVRSETDLHTLTSNVNLERLSNHPVRLSSTDLYKLVSAS